MTTSGLGHARMGEILVSCGLVNEAQLASALEIQRREGGLLGEVLVRELISTEEQIADALAEQRGLTRVNLAMADIQRDAVLLLPERMERLRQLIPISRHDGEIVVAMANPLDIEALDDVRMRTGLNVEAVVATPTQIAYAIDKYVSSADVVQGMFATEAATPEEEVDHSEDDAPVVRIVSQLFHDAVLDGASDIHIEPTKKNVRIRFRVDGVLHDVMELPRFAHAGIVSRIKVLSDMDLAERRRPQDGRISANVEGKPIDLRIATVPTPDGESVVIRVLNQEITFLTLPDLGMGPADLEKMLKLLDRPYGAIFVAGPTGAGKSTTLYASLSILNEPTRKIVTIEDPIEYRLAGVTQIPVSPSIGLTFAGLLRQVVRFDPDVVMVGEVRDHDTAEISARAALTGHLVLSSIHTNDAPSALTRMTDMGVPNYVTSSAMLGVVAQRLTRRLCEYCKQPDDVPYEALIHAGYLPEEAGTIMPMRAVGCEHCLNSGYKGREGLFEIMVMDDELRHMFLKDAPSDDLRQMAIANGMKTLRRDGLDKVAAGVTTLSELARVVAY